MSVFVGCGRVLSCVLEHGGICLHMCVLCIHYGVLLICLLVYSDSGDDIELASCPHGQASKDCSMVASCSCELLSEGEHRLFPLQYPHVTHKSLDPDECVNI